MNLNFYNPNSMGSLESLQTNLQEQINKLDQLRSIDTNNLTQSKPSMAQEQRYYLDCGRKEDWDDFLRINYNLTEKQIFEDYRLFLQAKAELNQDKDKEKLEQMKRKLTAPSVRENKEKANVQYNVQPEYSNQQPIQSVSAYKQPLCNESLVQLQSGTEQINSIAGNIQQFTQNQIENASNNPININQVSNPIVARQLEKNTNNYENKGAKHVR